MALGLWPWAMSGAALDQIDFFHGPTTVQRLSICWKSGISPSCWS